MGFGFVGDELGEEEKGEDWDVKTETKIWFRKKKKFKGITTTLMVFLFFLTFLILV